MSLSPEELEEHCNTILQSRRINNKIVILCEGDIQKASELRRSPSTYRKQDHLPDANFYKACIPNDWTQYKPEFFVCGDKDDVIKSYFKLLEINQKLETSYLDSEKLFAIVDLDIQPQKISNYQFPDKETIRQNIYQNFAIDPELISQHQHKIWVTGFVHKEAYFFLPTLKELFANYPTFIYFETSAIDLQKIYQQINQELTEDKDLIAFFPQVKQRASNNPNLNLTSVETFQTSWQTAFHQSPDDQNLPFALFSLAKAKPYWKKINSPNFSRSDDYFQEQLSLEIANYYSKNLDDPSNHISNWLQHLREQFYYQ